MKERFLARDYRENVVYEQINEVIFRHSFFSDTNIYFRLCIVMKKFKKSSCLVQWSHIEALENYQLERNVGCGGCWEMSSL